MKKKTALVSIVVPVYGTEAYLPACIDSLCNQSYANIEIILVNDQSTDKCPEICDSYAKKDSRIKVVHQKNKGVSGARNTGMRYANGEYITFVDSDDELEPNAIELLLHDITHYEADIASASETIVTKEGNLHLADNDGKIYIYEGEEMIKRSLMYAKETHSLHATLFAKEFIYDICFTEGHNINEDGYFLFECYTRLPKVVQHNVSVYKYFYRKNSASRAEFSEKYLDMLYFCDLKMKYIQEKMPEYTDDAKNMVVITNLLFLDVLCRTTNKKYLEIQKNCIQTVRELYMYHRPINEHQRQLVWIVSHGLYPIYKKAVRLKYYR